MSAHVARPRTAGPDTPVASADSRFKRFLKFLRRKGRSREDAKDLLIQEAMLRLSVYGRTADVENEDASLHSTAMNLPVDQPRQDHGDPLKQVPMEDLSARAPLMSTQPTPEAVLDNEQRLERIRAALDAVSPLTRAIYLANRAGYSYAEIAHHFNISHNTITRHMARALLAIMEHNLTASRGSSH
jgi:RNA polymerase sigma-70 factor (ECF subfamily)